MKYLKYIVAFLVLSALVLWLNGYPLIRLIKITAVFAAAVLIAVLVALTGDGAAYENDDVNDYPDW